MNTSAGLSPAESLVFGIIFTGITSVGVFGNILVVVAIVTDRPMRRSVMNMILSNLAVADLLNLLACSVEWVQSVAYGDPLWLLPAFCCPLFRYGQVLFLYASLLSQLTVCVERFIAIVFPLRAREICTKRRLLFVILISWIFSAIFALPYALFHRTSSNHCMFDRDRMANFMIYKFAECLLFYFGPLAASLALYSKVAVVLWNKDKCLVETCNQRRAEQLKVRKNIVKMLVACVAVYFICYSPIQIVFLHHKFKRRSSHTFFKSSLKSPGLKRILALNAITLASSAANPLLYSLFSQRFRHRFVLLLCCRQSAPETTAFNGQTTPKKSTQSTRL